MHYIVIKDNSPGHELAEYTDSNGNFFIIHETSANTVASGSGVIITQDISEYTILPSIAANNAAVLQSQKDNAILKITNALEKELEAGVVISHNSLKPTEWKAVNKTKAETTEPSKFAVSNSIILNGSSSNLVAFTQAATIISTAAAVATDPVAFGDLMVSAVFGRPLTDAHGDHVDMTVNQFRQLMLAFGFAVGSKQNTLLTKINEIKSATTEAEIKTILGS